MGLILPATHASGEVHGLCPVLSGQLNSTLRNRSGGLLDQIARQAGNNAGGVRQAINAVRNGVNDGTLTGGDLVELAKAVRTAAAPAAQAEINVAIARLAVNQQVLLWLRSAPLDATAFPPGRNVPIALVPGIPLLTRGRIVPLGLGPVLIGVDQPGDTIVLGEGDVEEVAKEVADGSVAKVQATLANAATTPVNYTVNQQPYKMEPKYEQALNGGSSWVVEFDRGGGNGTARYELTTDGYYEFTVTPKGWELYRKEAPPAGPPPAGPPPAAKSAYAQAAGMRLPPDFKLFDPIPTLTGGGSAPTTAQLPENFTLFRAAADKVAQSQ